LSNQDEYDLRYFYPGYSHDKRKYEDELKKEAKELEEEKRVKGS
jgi:hypothetical protein